MKQLLAAFWACLLLSAATCGQWCTAYSEGGVPNKIVSHGSVAPTEQLSKKELLDIAAEIDSLILAGKFDAVEEKFRALLKRDAPRSRIGDLAAVSIYLTLFEPSAGRYQSALERWVGERPKSALAHLLLSRVLHKLAWEARGQTYIGKVPSEAQGVYQSHLSASLREVDTAASLEEHPPVLLHSLSLAKERDASADEVKRLFERANASMPDSWAVHYEYLTALSPKWGGGSEEHLFKTARTIAKGASSDSALVGVVIQAQDLVCAAHGGKKAYLSAPATWEEREAAYKELIARFPRAGYFIAAYAGDAFLVGKKDLAIAMLRKALEAEPDHPDVIKLATRYAHLLTDPQSMGGTSGVVRDDVTPVLADARVAFKEKRFSAAEELYRKAIEMHPTRSSSWHMAGVMMVQQGRFKDAVPFLLRATELSPKRAPYYTQLCHARMMSGEVQQGVEDCTKAISLNANEKHAYLNRAHAYQMMGKSKEAESDRRIAGSLP